MSKENTEIIFTKKLAALKYPFREKGFLDFFAAHRFFVLFSKLIHSCIKCM